MTAITVEDGSGIAGADAYAAVATISTYILDHYGTAAQTTWDNQTEPDRLAREGSLYVDIKYRPRWPGTRANETQGMDHPRSNMEDSDGYTIASTVVHQSVIDAACEAAYRAQTVTLFADETTPGDFEGERVKVGPIEVEERFSSGREALPRFSKIDRILSAIISGGAGVRWRG